MLALHDCMIVTVIVMMIDYTSMKLTGDEVIFLLVLGNKVLARSRI